jgi:hypothetical protein
MVTWLEDVNRYDSYNGTAWVPLVPQSQGNAIINGAFDIWQRGTSIALASGSGFTADRFAVQVQSVASTISRQTGTSQTTGGNFALRFQRNSGGTGTNQQFIAQSLPNLDSASLIGRTVTLSFYAKAGANYSTSGSTLGATIFSSTGTDQNFITVALTGQSTVASAAVTLTTGLQRFTITGTVPTNATQVHIAFDRIPVGTAGANDWFELEGVQLEVGPVATPFKRNANSIQGELAACQRYYLRTASPFSGSNSAQSTLGFSTSATVLRASIPLKQTMRVAPTGIEFASLQVVDGVAGFAITSVTFANTASADYVDLLFTTGGGMTTFRPGFVNTTSGGGFLGLNAEL